MDFSPAAPHRLEMSPTGLSLSMVACLQSPASVSPGLVVRSSERSISFYTFPHSTFERVFFPGQRQLVLAAILTNKALLGRLADG
jgi:hypothetical protein